MQQQKLVVPAFVLAAGLIVSALVLSNAWMTHLKTTRQTLDVTGSAKITIESDLGILRGTISSAAPTASEAYRALGAQKPTLTAYLEQGGFAPDALRMFPPTTFATWEYDSNGHQTGRALKHTYAQRFEASSANVRLVESVSRTIAELVERGVTLNLEMPAYHFTKLADIKMDVQALAAEDARMRAERIAEASHSKLGPIRRARMGVLQITPLHGNAISSYGVNDLSSIEKDQGRGARVVFDRVARLTTIRTAVAAVMHGSTASQPVEAPRSNTRHAIASRSPVAILETAPAGVAPFHVRAATSAGVIPTPYSV